MLKLIPLLLITFIILGCNSATKKPAPARLNPARLNRVDSSFNKPVAETPVDTLFENRIFDSIFKIPQIKKSHDYIDSFTHHKRGIAMMVVQRPVSDSDYYIVQVGFNGDERFVTYYNFHIYRKGFKIEYLDPVTDSTINVNRWKE